KRLAQVPVVLWVLITISFFMMRLAPGGPFSGERRMDPVIEQAIRAKYHLDKSWPEQYGRFMGELVLDFDLGPSFKYKTQTVNQILAERAPVSAVLGVSATLIALVLGLGAGVIAGIRQNSNFDYLSMTGAMIGLSVPVFVVGPLLQLAFCMTWNVFPVAGYEPGWTGVKYLILPSLTLALPLAARIAR